MSPNLLILTSSQNGAMSGTEKMGNGRGENAVKEPLKERTPFVSTYIKEQIT